MQCAASPRIAVVGGGAAGMMAALTAAQNGACVTLFERTGRLGRKLRITGKGRCNVTNDCDINEFLANVMTNPRFLYTALNRFSTADTKDFFESCGVPLKTERGRRVFPVSDRAADIVSALADACHRAGVKVVYERVGSLWIEDGALRGVLTPKDRFEADAVIVCTGGKSYPLTGSDGDGYALAEQAGHTVTQLSPSLVPMTTVGDLCPALQGLSLKNVRLTIARTDNGKAVFEDFGEMMFTHFGLTGPMVLSASAHVPDIQAGKYEAVIDLKPALDDKMLDTRILSDFEKYKNKDFANALGDLLPQKMIPVIIRLSGIDPHIKVNAVTREQRRALVALLKGLRVGLKGFRPIEEAIVTRGGVSVREVNPKTMESKSLAGLYFAGEVLDVDAYTGGYNLQIAFSTAVVAGENAAWGGGE
ncbi:MAG: NAD(P)/FAD-dependent oxidoreductase [Ruminococcaceae bacterium]|nr:NAD(P)/FAD-dependent oxidoreductase [Oscillospiraceae bacterium]